MVNSRVRNRVRYYTIRTGLNIGWREFLQAKHLLALGGLCGFGCGGRVDRRHRRRNPGRLRTQP